MRLVKHHRRGLRQNSRVRRTRRLLFHAQVGKKQVVVDDNDVRLKCLPAHLRDKAPPVIRAGRPQAGLGARIQLVPQRAHLRQAVNLSPIPGLRHLFPLGNLPILVNLFQARQDGLTAQRHQLVPAKIVRAPLHVAHAQRAQQRFKKRYVAEEKLILQRLGARRNNHPLSRAQRRQQIRKRLAGARSRLHNQVAAFLKGAFHGLRHLQLPGPVLIRQR